VKNALREPRVIIKFRDQAFGAMARTTKNDSEEALARHPLYEKYSLAEDEAKSDLSISDWARSGLPVCASSATPMTSRLNVSCWRRRAEIAHNREWKMWCG
jgi:hypothetical protein